MILEEEDEEEEEEEEKGKSHERKERNGRRNLCVTSTCHFVRVFARVIDRHATLIGGWNERHDRTR